MIEKRKKGQSINEYALILGIITVVLVSMQTYFKRGIHGVIRRTADEIGLNAETDWKNYYDNLVLPSDSPLDLDYLLPAHTLGAMEQGLIYYKLGTKDDGSIDFLTSNTTKTTKTFENKKGAAVKAQNVVSEETIFKGEWISVNKFDSFGTFSSSEKVKE